MYALGVLLYELLAGFAADRREAVKRRRDAGDAADGAGGGAAAAEHQAEHGRRIAELAANRGMDPKKLKRACGANSTGS